MAIDEDSLNLGDLGDLGDDSEILDKPISLDDAFDIDLGDDAPNDIEIEEMATEVGGDDDEIATKLDLARAYVEMGDEEGARSILEEVSTEGSDLQKSEAVKLLSELA